MLLERESALLSEIQLLEARYRGKGVAEQIRDLTATKEQVMTRMKGDENKETLKQGISLLDARMTELEEDLETVKDRLGSVVFEWDGELERMLSETGVIRVSAALDYKKKWEPVKTACKCVVEMADGVFAGPTSKPKIFTLVMVKMIVYRFLLNLLNFYSNLVRRWMALPECVSVRTKY